MTESNMHFLANRINPEKLSYEVFGNLKEYIIMDVEFDANQLPYSICAIHYRDGKEYRKFEGWAGEGALTPMKFIFLMENNPSKTFAQAQQMTKLKMATDFKDWLETKIRKDVPIINYDNNNDSTSIYKVLKQRVVNPAYDMAQALQLRLGELPTLEAYHAFMTGQPTQQEQYFFKGVPQKKGLHTASFDVNLIHNIMIVYSKLVDKS